MTKNLCIAWGVLLISIGCGETRPRSAAPPSGHQDGAVNGDANTNGLGDANGSGSDAASLDAGMNAGDAQNTDSGTSPLDAGHLDSDGGISGFMCDPMFGAADACGGDAVGMWIYRAGCIDPSVFGMLSAQCRGAVRSNEIQITSGFFSITATMTYRRVFHDEYSADVDVPSICVTLVGSCALIKSAVEFAIPGSVATCNPSAGGGCLCHVEIIKDISDRGTYTLPSAGVARLSPDDGSDPSDYYYCVDNSGFRYKGSTTTANDHSVSYVLTP